jgi:hypothetical protein
MTANPTKSRFRRKTLAWDALAPGIRSTRSRVAATAHRGAVVRRPILVCRWIAVEGGRLECRWSIEVIDGSSREEPKSRLSIGRPLDVERSRNATPALRAMG